MDENREIEQGIWKQVWAAEASRDRWKTIALLALALLALIALLQFFPHGGFGPDSHP